MSPFAEEPSPITLSDGQTPSSIVIIGPSNWLLTLMYPEGFRVERFIEVIETEAVWEEIAAGTSA